MNPDARIAESLRRVGESVHPDVQGQLARVHQRASRRARRRVALGFAAAAAVVVVILGLLLDGGSTHRTNAPVDNNKRAVAPNPFTVLRTYSASSMGLEHVLGMAIAPSGNLYLTDSTQTVAEMSPDGEILRRWGGPGTAPGRFRMANGAIAVGGDGRVYVVDTGNFRIQVFTATGQYVSSVGAFGTGPGQFLWPYDIVVDGSGHLYVTDDRAATLTKLTAAGRQLWRVGEAGSNPHLVGHEHVSQLDSRGRLVVANDDAGLVLFLDPSGWEADSFGSGASGGHETGRFPNAGLFPGGACDATVDNQGFVYITSCQDPRLAGHSTEVLDGSQRLVGMWRDNPLSRSPRFGPGRAAYGVTFDGSVVSLGLRH